MQKFTAQTRSRGQWLVSLLGPTFFFARLPVIPHMVSAFLNGTNSSSPVKRADSPNKLLRLPCCVGTKAGLQMARERKISL